MAATKKKAQKGKGTKSSAKKTAPALTAEEELYVTRTLEPLLAQMGFFDITHRHELPELGSDILFASHNKFGHKVLCAAHVTAEEISGRKKKELSAIIEHALTVFEARVVDGLTKREAPISELYVITSQGFTDGAEEQLAAAEELAPYRRGLFLLDGQQIELLCARNAQQLKELLIAERNELTRNSKVAQFNMDSWSGGKASLFRYQLTRTQALVDHLLLHELDELRSKLEKYLLLLDSFNQASSIVLFSDTPSLTGHYVKRLQDGASAVFKQSEDLLHEIEQML